jgi:hypothetical protein
MVGIDGRSVKGIVFTTLSFVVGAPFTLAGLGLCFTGIFLLPGLILLVLGALPLVWVERQKLKYKLRDQPLEEEDVEKPWE